MANDIEMKCGEGKWINFTVTRDGLPVNMSGEEVLFAVKQLRSDTTYLLLKSGESFDKTRTMSGEVAVNVTVEDTLALGEGNFFAALKIVFEDSTDVDLSQNIPFILRGSVFHD